MEQKNSEGVSKFHEPVLLEETLSLLLENKDSTLVRTYVDCTLGGGGYTKKILESTAPDIKVIAIDRDIFAIEHCKAELKEHEGRIIYAEDNFANIAGVLKKNSAGKISGIVMDLGLSSYQIGFEDGFSYQRNTKLDMRADKSQRLTAADVLNKYDEQRLIEIFRNYGELRYYKQVTRDIISQRKEKEFETTFDLVELLKEKIPPRYLNKDLSKVFQAIRIEVNAELENLKQVITDSIEYLESGAKIVAISYHSLEDRIVKNLLRMDERLKVITKKPVEATDREIGANTRARSAKLRSAMKKDK